jgi:hypothetical protein
VQFIWFLLKTCSFCFTRRCVQFWFHANGVQFWVHANGVQFWVHANGVQLWVHANGVQLWVHANGVQLWGVQFRFHAKGMYRKALKQQQASTKLSSIGIFSRWRFLSSEKQFNEFECTIMPTRYY